MLSVLFRCMFVYDLSGEEKQKLSLLELMEVCLSTKEGVSSMFCYTQGRPSSQTVNTAPLTRRNRFSSAVVCLLVDFKLFECHTPGCIVHKGEKRMNPIRRPRIYGSPYVDWFIET